MIPPGKEIECDSGSAPVAICMLDALLCDYSNLLPLMQNQIHGIAYNISQEDRYINAFTKHYYEEQATDKIYRYLDELVSHIHPQSHQHNVDSRIARVIEAHSSKILETICP